MKAARELTLITTALTVLATPALARTVLNCDVTEVIIASSPAGSTSTQKSGQLGFLVDDVPKTLMFSDGKTLEVTRFDQEKINANYGDIEFVLDRRNGVLTYAGSNTMGNTTKTIIGSGHCTSMPSKRSGSEGWSLEPANCSIIVRPAAAARNEASEAISKRTSSGIRVAYPGKIELASARRGGATPAVMRATSVGSDGIRPVSRDLKSFGAIVRRPPGGRILITRMFHRPSALRDPRLVELRG
jgi:hypothetical protein